MNNLVEIIYKKGSKTPTVAINGEEISRYMELSDYIFDDIYTWTDKLYESMDDELSENYRIELQGHAFQLEMLKAARSLSQYCTEIKLKEISYDIPMEEKFRYAVSAAESYKIAAPRADKVVFQCSDPEYFEGLSLSGCEFTKENSDFAICREGEDARSFEAKTVIVLGKSVRCRSTRRTSTLELPVEMLQGLVDYLNLFHVYLEYVNEVFSALGAMDLSPETKLELEAYANEEYRVLVPEIPDVLDSGERYELDLKVFPACLPAPKLVLRSDNPSVISCEGNTLVCKKEGTCTIKICDALNNEYGSRVIAVEEHSYIKSINIVIPKTSISIDESLHLRYIMAPVDAEDIKKVRYTVSDDSIASFSSNNELYGLSAGRVKVTVSTPRVSSSVYITVLPRAIDVVLPEKQLDMIVNSEADIACTVFPANASPMPIAQWSTTNTRVIKIVSASEYACKVRSVGKGEAKLVCRLQDTMIERSIDINVSTRKGCYVATAVYGSYDCPEVWALRRYRDDFLSSSALGRGFIKLYYAISPTAIKIFGKTKIFNRVCKSILDRKVEKLREKGYEDTPYND